MAANLLIRNAHLPLGDPEAASWSVRVADGRIAEVVPTEVGVPEAPPGTETLDAAGRSVLPAFADSHVHVPESGVELLRCDLTVCESRDEVLRTVADYARSHLGEEWIIGRGWALPHFAEHPPTRQELDAVCGGRPAYLANRDGHSAWVSTAALDRVTPELLRNPPPGGRVDRDADGSPTGLLHESAMQLVSDLVPAVGAEDLRRGLLEAQRRMFSYGVTSWQDAIVGPFVPTTDIYDVYRRAAADGSLRARVTGALWWPRDASADTLAGLVEQRRGCPPDSRFSCTAIKIMYDGVCETHTAALSRPYVGIAGAGTGLTFFDPADMARAVPQMDAAGFDLHFHAIGDRAVSECLDLVEAAQQANGPRDRRHQLAHLQIADDRSVARMAALGVIANVQPYWAQADPQMLDMTIPYLPGELAALQYRFRTLEDAGVRVAFGSDWPVSTPNPLDWIHVAVNRSHPDEPGAPLFAPEEAMSLRSALRAATAGSAHALRREHEAGTLEPGARADLVVLDRRLDETVLGEISRTRVDLTLIDGEPVWTR
ncbi:amidohydrolase [Peterkaempfera bronchialis]|uniref:Amidohydrolase n=1 Tax=Peterkaempfera bronchialis TaxID=2126346 RepID=A0A345T1C1_9ACTN|nr:amidohydrolase [Peterkaempfera bronchialis]AXI79776.1 amidohydrolase [Peterkaempfera bronchialis]